MLSLSSEAGAVDLLLCRENYLKNKSESESHSVVSDSFRPHGLEFSRSEYWNG